MVKSLKHFKNVSGDNSVFELYLFGEIGWNVDGDQLAKEIGYINSNYPNATIKEYINSGGGSIINGYSLVSANNDSKVKIVTINQGLAGSMAGVIFVTGKERIMKDYSMMMIHDPLGGGTSLEEAEGKDKDVLETFKKSLVTILANNSNLSEAKISKLMTEETWLSDTQAVEFGFADRVEKTKRKPKSNVKNVTAFVNNCTELFKTEKMEEVIKYLGLPTDASQSDIINAIKKIEDARNDATGSVTNFVKAEATYKQEVETAKNLGAELLEKNKALEAKLREVEEAKNAELISKYVSEGRIAAEHKTAALEMLNKDKQGFEAAMSIFVGNQKPNILGRFKNNGSGDKNPDGSNKTLLDYSEAELKAMAPEKVEKLQEEYLNTKED